MKGTWEGFKARLRRLFRRGETPASEGDAVQPTGTGETAPGTPHPPSRADPRVAGTTSPPLPAAQGFLRDIAVGRFIEGSFANAAGRRAYRLFVPGGARGRRPLVVMLHGCKQDAADFARGTHMNELGQSHGWFVLYPEQDRAANALGCWNWFHKGNQLRDQGEPSIIADMTREVMASHPVDPLRVYVAGISAGGAMASILASHYPDLYAAVGVHSGLPHAAASDVVTALRAMRRGPTARSAPRETGSTMPTIVFHGDNDRTVHPSNGEEVIAQARWSSRVDGDDDADGSAVDVESGTVPGGRSFTRTLHRDRQGRVDAEHWLVHGSAHAWSGGSAEGSFTDPLGPDASQEMLRFFEEHPRRAGAWLQRAPFDAV